MAAIGAEEAAGLACGTWINDPPRRPLGSFAIDTRTIRPGETFIALRGKRDGHDFLESAREQMALAAIVEEPEADLDLPQLVVEDTLECLQTLAGAWREQFLAPVIGITGSFGKTTVKELLGNLLGSIWFRTYGNFNNHIGVPLSLLELDPAHHAGAIIEAGINQVEEMDRLAELIQPDMAIVTAVGPAHLEMLGSLEGVAREKAKLAQAVAAGGNIFLPAGLLQYEAFQSIPPAVRVHAIAEEDEVVPGAIEEMHNLKLYRYHWRSTRSSRGMGELVTQSPMPAGSYEFQAGSDGMISNLALAVHVALFLGVPDATLQGRLDSWRPFRHRGEVVTDGKRTFYVDCYNANPGSMLDSAGRFRSLFDGRPQVYVLGSMNELGEDSEIWHEKTGRKMNIPSDGMVYLMGHGAASMAKGLRSRGLSDKKIRIMEDLEQIKAALDGFEGAVFLKGSRSYALERILPVEVEPC